MISDRRRFSIGKVSGLVVAEDSGNGRSGGEFEVHLMEVSF